MINPLKDLSTTTTFFLKCMETIDYWTPLWRALYQNGASAKSEDATHRFWLTLTPEQQAQVSQTIVRKVAAGDFVWYNPIRAIQENIRRTQTPGPTFLRGDEKGPIVQVKYNGMFKLCTPETEKAFHLEHVRNWNF